MEDPKFPSSPSKAALVQEEREILFQELKNRIQEIDNFVPQLLVVRKKLKHKKKSSVRVINEKMTELRILIDKWERRFVETANETIDEKIDTLRKQERDLLNLQNEMKEFIQRYSEYPFIPNWVDDDIEGSISHSFEDTEEIEREEKVIQLKKFMEYKFPLFPAGVKEVELQFGEEEFDQLLDEAKKSLKRSLSFVGAIVRGYLRRGSSNEKWVQMIRQLESRNEPDVGENEIMVSNIEKNAINPDKFVALNRVWKAISDIYIYRANESLRDELCNQLNELYADYPTEIEFYLPQLLVIVINNKTFRELMDFILMKCYESIHFALKTHLLLSSFKSSDGSHTLSKRCKRLLKLVELAIPKESQINIGVDRSKFLEMVHKTHIQQIEAKDSNQSGSTRKAKRRMDKEYFFKQLNFMKEMVKISQELGSIFGETEQYMPELLRHLSEMENKYVTPGYAYLPFMSTARHKVVRIALDECFPIGTYGRVLFWAVLEVIPVPVNYTIQMANELVANELDGDNSTETESEAYENAREEDSDEENIGTGAFGVPTAEREKRIKADSPFYGLESWSTRSLIVKHGDCVLQEQFVMQLIRQFQNIFDENGLPLPLCYYRITALSADSGIIEVIPDAISLDAVKQKSGCKTLLEFFKKEYPTEEQFTKATQNFRRSVAAYSLVCYFLQIKDRHNGNIMLSADGSLVHIDFGYLLGRTMKFEKAPFKLTDEFIEVMGGRSSEGFSEYYNLCVEGFLAIRRGYEKILMLVEMSSCSSNFDGQFVPCLSKDSVLMKLRSRFRLSWSEKQIRELVLNLIVQSTDNWRTTIYDTYQHILNGIQI
eukprot:TRINITY_DN6697_c0_g1_i1.p1 TRINITY_DN6697_c0_g1~~TRINITY_DN6697_c0_g1_i1.p1  ORF type:complete len:840 (-),score=188.13 TRINITY_DN6697_c0_g1_i1:52-2538(-)